MSVTAFGVLGSGVLTGKYTDTPGARSGAGPPTSHAIGRYPALPARPLPVGSGTPGELRDRPDRSLRTDTTTPCPVMPHLPTRQLRPADAAVRLGLGPLPGPASAFRRSPTSRPVSRAARIPTSTQARHTTAQAYRRALSHPASRSSTASTPRSQRLPPGRPDLRQQETIKASDQLRSTKATLEAEV
jgi:hypothetical protein